MGVSGSFWDASVDLKFPFLNSTPVKEALFDHPVKLNFEVKFGTTCWKNCGSVAMQHEVIPLAISPWL